MGLHSKQMWLLQKHDLAHNGKLEAGSLSEDDPMAVHHAIYENSSESGSSHSRGSDVMSLYSAMGKAYSKETEKHKLMLS